MRAAVGPADTTHLPVPAATAWLLLLLLVPEPGCCSASLSPTAHEGCPSVLGTNCTSPAHRDESTHPTQHHFSTFQLCCCYRQGPVPEMRSTHTCCSVWLMLTPLEQLLEQRQIRQLTPVVECQTAVLRLPCLYKKAVAPAKLSAATHSTCTCAYLGCRTSSWCSSCCTSWLLPGAYSTARSIILGTSTSHLLYSRSAVWLGLGGPCWALDDPAAEWLCCSCGCALQNIQGARRRQTYA